MILENENFKLALNSALHKTDVSGSALINADCMDILPFIPDKSVQLIFADPPYFKIKGEFDFIWKSFDDYLKDVKKWAIECKRILSDNGTILWYGHSKNIAYSQIVLDKYFKLESSIAIELTAGHIRRSNKESFRRFAPCSERILMYSTGKNNKELCTDLINKINETATAKDFIDCFMKLGICKNEASAKVLATYKIGKHKTRFDLMSKEMYDFIGGWNYSYEYFTELFNKSIRTFNSKGITDVFRYKENTNDMSSTNHPTQKPMALTKMFIEMTTNQNDNIVIPFTGSGTECLGAKELNRKFIGIEKEVKYYDLAVARVFG
jgi:site-specific DNA-methyltransferase (adenine-specific)